MVAKMTAAFAAENLDDEGARFKRQKMCPPSPVPIVSTDPFDGVRPTTSTEPTPPSLPSVEEYNVHSQRQSRFFQLPMELRDMIYDLACVNDGVSALLQKGSSRQASQDSAREPAFLRSCRLARQDGLAVFYQKNDFVVRRRDSVNFHPRPAADMELPFSFKSLRGGVPRWLDGMSNDNIAKIRSVVLVQISRGVYKDARNEWRRDASACFRLKLSKKKEKGYEIEYVRVDSSGRSDKYAERLVEALEMRMDMLAEKTGAQQWNRRTIWDMAYLL